MLFSVFAAMTFDVRKLFRRCSTLAILSPLPGRRNVSTRKPRHLIPPPAVHCARLRPAVDESLALLRRPRRRCCISGILPRGDATSDIASDGSKAASSMARSRNEIYKIQSPHDDGDDLPPKPQSSRGVRCGWSEEGLD